MKVENLVHTCHACPSQWEFLTDGGREAYVRYRWGWLSVRVARNVGEPGVSGMEVLGSQLGDPLDGVIGWDSVEALIRDIDVEKMIGAKA